MASKSRCSPVTTSLVAARVCEQVGLHVGQPVTGPQLERMSDSALAATLKASPVRSSHPLHKGALSLRYAPRGRVVGFMGDGINDAPALRAADIGISVDSAVDIAKEAADIILLEKA